MPEYAFIIHCRRTTTSNTGAEKNSSMGVEAIIFDCDGTLVDTERIENTVLLDFAREFGLSLTFDEAIRQFAGVKMSECVEIIEAAIGRPLPDDFVPVFRHRCRDEFEAGLKPIDGVVEVLEQITWPYCVASNGPLEKLELTLGLTGLKRFFSDRVFSAYEIDVWKPAPDLFLHAARSMNVTPEQCVVVEDSLPGIQAGLAAGMHVIGFRMHDLPEMLADRIHSAGNFNEIPQIISSIR